MILHLDEEKEAVFIVVEVKGQKRGLIVSAVRVSR